MSSKLLLTVNWIEPAETPTSTPAVRCIGGKSGDFSWQHSEAQAIAHIEDGLFDYFVTENSEQLKLEVASALNGRKYLKVNNGQEIPLSQLHLPPGP